MTRLHASLLFALLLAACSTEQDPEAGQGKDATKAKDTAPKVSGPASAGGMQLGQITATELINLNAIINKSPAEVKAALGDPSETGSDQISCVRFVPERVFFACEQEVHLYPHPQFEELRVEFEDGLAATVGISGLPGSGVFEPVSALASVGVSLPGTPRHDNPPIGMGAETEDLVDRWEWGNDNARLLIDGLEHRVRLSVVNGEWRRAKLELILNHPLNDAQKAKIKPVRGEGDAPAPEPGVSVGEPAH